MSFGNIANVTPVFEIPQNTSAYDNSESYSGGSLWSRFSNGIAGIGNWFANKSKRVISVLSIISLVIIVVSCIEMIIDTWINEGFLMALFAAVCVGIVGVIIRYLVLLAIVISVNLVMYAFRFLFWNGWSLLISLILSAGCWIYASNSSYFNDSDGQPQTETVSSLTKSYQCTAKVLNIRSAPDANSSVIGTIKKGQKVEVFDITNEFARISYKGQTGYVSLQYLSKQD